MPNGTGKTTTLELLRAALSGKHPAGEWTEDRVRALQKLGNNNGHGKFQLSLLHNTRRLTIALSFDFDEGSVSYTTTLPSGIQEGFHPPRELEQFLKPAFVNFYIFDGELAEHLLNRERTDAQTAVEDLFQLRIFQRLSDRVNGFWEDQTLDLGATEERGLSRRKNRVQKLRERIKILSVQCQRLQGEYDRLDREISEKKKRYSAALNEHKELSQQLQKASQDLMSAKAAVEKTAQDLFGQMRDPHALSRVFALEMIDLKTGLDRAKLPESTAREFFEELAQETLCVCGRSLDEVTRQAVRDRASQYFGSENVALLNAIKGDISSLVQTTLDSAEKSLAETIAALRRAEHNWRDFTTVKERIEADVSRLDPALGQIQAEVADAQTRLEGLKDDLARFSDPSDAAGDDEIYGIQVLKARLENAERKYAEVTKTIDLKKKRDVLIQLLDLAQTKARNEISKDLCREANNRIANLMPYNFIRIDKVERCLVLRGQEGGSVGETLSVGYAFLSTLFNRSDYQLPFVVDSPANPIDLQVRPRIAELVRSLTDQFIAFMISSERQGFMASLEKAGIGDIQHLTLFRKGSTQLEQAAQRDGGLVQTGDGICVQSRDFFNAFHLDEEERNAL
jgi:predicted nuclease with TOPRIM domain